MRVATSPARVVTYSCSLEVIVAVLGGKWKPGILFNLLQAPCGFAELRKRLGVSEKVLAQQLRDLEAHGVITRAVGAGVPARVTYSLSEYGKTLRPILVRMGSWGERHLVRLKQSTAGKPPHARPRARSEAQES